MNSLRPKSAAKSRKSKEHWLKMLLPLVLIGSLAANSQAFGKSSSVDYLTAGPIHLKFADGELRHLYVGNKEIVRRVYFAVRDRRWNTAMPDLTQVTVRKQAQGFTIDLKAHCYNEQAEYQWTGRIIGTPDGRITFEARGAAARDFESPRIGICVLYGAGSLVGQRFETIGADGAVTTSAFPRFVSPTLVAAKFHMLRYVTAPGLTVESSISGTLFDMEDQRTYGDSSFKAYAPLAYPYPAITSGGVAKETYTLQVKNAPQSKAAHLPVRVIFGTVLPEAKVPQFHASAAGVQNPDFGAINGSRDRYRNASALAWSLSPSVHLPDNDNFMDNRLTIVDQVKTVHSFAPDAVITIEPISLKSFNRRLPSEAAQEDQFSAAWTAALIKYFALAGVSAAGFDLGTKGSQAVLDSIQPFVGRPLVAAMIEANGYSPVDAFALEDGSARQVWLINITDLPQETVLAALPKRAKGEMRFIADQSRSNIPVTATPQGTVAVKLAPYAVCNLRFEMP